MYRLCIKFADARGALLPKENTTSMYVSLIKDAIIS